MPSILLHVCCSPCSLMPVLHLREEGWDVTAFFFNPNIHPADEWLRRRDAMRLAAEKLSLPLLEEGEPVNPGQWVRRLPLSPHLEASPSDSFPHPLPEARTEVPGRSAGTDDSSSFPLPRLAEEASARLFQTCPSDPLPMFAKEAQDSPRFPPRRNPLPRIAEAAYRQGNRCPSCYAPRMARTAELCRERGFSAFTTSLLYSRYQCHGKIREEAEKAAALFGAPFLYRDFRPFWWDGIALSKEMGLYRQKWCGCILSMKEALLQRKEAEERKQREKAAKAARLAAEAEERRHRKAEIAARRHPKGKKAMEGPHAEAN